MKRRDFIALAGATILSVPGLSAAASAQQPGGRKRVGYLHNGGNPDGSILATTRAYLDATRAGLKDEGFTDGANVTLDVRFGRSDPGLIRAAAHDLAGGGYDVLVSSNTPTTAALLAETRTMPIVFGNVSDPVGAGFIQSFARPGGNVTGFTNVDASMAGKWLDMLHQAAPGVRRAVMMFNLDTGVGGNFFLPSFRPAAAALGMESAMVDVRTLDDIDAAIAAMGKVPGTGLVVIPDGFTLANRRTVLDAVTRQNLPAIYAFTDFVDDGGLIGYGSDNTDISRNMGRYVGLILKGSRPGDLPVQAPTKFVLSVNLKTARAQGITIPPTLVALADKVIE